MDIKDFKDALTRMIDAMPQGASMASVSWKSGGRVFTICASETYGTTGNWTISLSEFPDVQALTPYASSSVTVYPANVRT